MKGAGEGTEAMKTFQGKKDGWTIKAQCEANGWAVPERAGVNLIRFSFQHEGMSAEVFYNAFTGIFYGTTHAGQKFTCDDTELDDEPWFAALLDFCLRK